MDIPPQIVNLNIGVWLVGHETKKPFNPHDILALALETIERHKNQKKSMKTEDEIKPTTTVYSLLKSHPELEELLISMAPAFKRLKNPILRNTIAKVATLKQAASAGGIDLNEMISILRKAVGQDKPDATFSNADYLQEKPLWFSPEKVIASIDESTLKDKNKMPITYVLKEAKNLKDDEIIELITSFLPAPLIDVMRN